MSATQNANALPITIAFTNPRLSETAKAKTMKLNSPFLMQETAEVISSSVSNEESKAGKSSASKKSTAPL